MSEGQLPFQIRESLDPEGGALLELKVEGKRIATGKASREVLEAMQAQLGLDRDAVVQLLAGALHDHLRSQLPRMTISAPKELPDDDLKFVSSYIYRHLDEIRPGVVWYDIRASETGPEDAPPLVRNKMRFEVHRKLTEGSEQTRALVDLLK